MAAASVEEAHLPQCVSAFSAVSVQPLGLSTHSPAWLSVALGLPAVFRWTASTVQPAQCILPHTSIQGCGGGGDASFTLT